MDNTANEVDGVSVSSYPTLIFYPANKKGSKGITFDDGARTVESFLPWLAAHSKASDWTVFHELRLAENAD